MDLSKATFWGFKRENGRIGVRNHVIILPVDDLFHPHALAASVEQHLDALVASTDRLVPRKVILPQHLLRALFFRAARMAVAVMGRRRRICRRRWCWRQC